MNKNQTFILAGNGPYENRGCEAIVRGTLEIIRHVYKNPSFLCISNFQNNKQYIKQCEKEFDKYIVHKKTNLSEKVYGSLSQKIFSSEWHIHNILKAVNSEVYTKYVYKEMLPHIIDAKAVLSVGGDNYSLDYGIPKLFTDLDDIVLKNKIPLVIWGASIGPFEKIPKYEGYMAEHLRNVTAIYSRESATIEYLAKIGIVDNVFKSADPAFLMESVKPKNELNIDGGAIGMNLSPLMAKYVTDGNMDEWIKKSAKIVSAISKKTSLKVYLIPHVTSPHTNDYEFLKEVMTFVDKEKEDIILVPPIYNASETKWIISKMLIFAGSRTHSTIAALSSCIPTLSFAYSMKAKGINFDIFGHDDYCLNPSDLEPEKIVEKIEYMLKNNDEIRRNLSSKIPEIKRNALNSGKHLKEILEL